MEINIAVESLKSIFEPELVSEITNYSVQKLKKGDIVTTEAEIVEAIPIILKGKMEVSQLNVKNVNTHLYEINPVQSCIISLISGQERRPSPAGSSILKESSIIFVPIAKTKEWFDKYNSWRHFILDLYDQRLNELIRSKNLIQEQANNIEIQKKEITESITYSKKIQTTLLQSEQQFTQNVPNSFVWNRPKDIVSGDFFWSKKYQNKVYFAVADCTGHGVPGAMISIVCYQTLDKVVSDFPNIKLGEILNKIHEKIQQLFDPSHTKVNDGMDISLCCYDKSLNRLSFSGANNSIYRVIKSDYSGHFPEAEMQENGTKLIEYKADKQGIGGVGESNQFRTHEIECFKGDLFYLTSDGFQDQFGGENNKKMMKKRMKKHFSNNIVCTLDESLNNLEIFFNEWKGKEEQTDDALIIGFKPILTKD